MSKERILITGGSGFLGINLVHYLIKKGYRNILVLDILDFVGQLNQSYDCSHLKNLNQLEDVSILCISVSG
jgi:nucleoside-diphosphate-sugar epimerase